MATKKRLRDFTDSNVQALIDFREDSPNLEGLWWDTQVKGLRLRIGKRRATWTFFDRRRDHNKRRATCKTLGHYERVDTVVGHTDRVWRGPNHMSVEAARDAARVLAARVIEGNAPAGKKSGIKFEAAFESYVEYLESKAKAKGKPARWAYNVRRLGAQLLLPRWSGWTLAEMSERPELVEEWHKAAAKQCGPTSANHAARILRAMYRRRARKDLSLSKANNPAAAVDMHEERGEQKGLAVRDFPKWKAALDQIPSPIRRAYHRANLLTGARPGELSRCRWQDVSPDGETLTIGDAKAGNDIAIPISKEIAAALKLAKDAQPDAKPGDLIFPGARHNPTRDKLPAVGHALRRTYKTIATDHCKVPDDISAMLLGHVPEGMSQRYLLRRARSSGPAIIEAQAKISRRIVELLRTK
jgi:integrase